MSEDVPYRDDLLKVERAAVNAWPALESRRIDGWLWRFSQGGSYRANSVSTLDYTGRDLAASITAVEDLYKARGGKLQFQISQVSAPKQLDQALAERGYRIESPVITMAKPVAYDVESALEGIGWGPQPDPRWLHIYGSVIDESRRRVVRRILERVPQPRAFVFYRQNRITFSTALGVCEDGMVCIACVATREETRRRGGARKVLAGIEAWARTQGAHTLHLQVDADNAAAIKLYQSLGFEAVGRMHYRVKVLEGFMAPPPDAAADHLAPGTRLRSVGLTATTGGIVDPAQVRGRSVLYAYTWTGAPGVPNPPGWDHIWGAHGSTPQTEGFRDLYPTFKAMGVEVLGLSTQASSYQRELVQRLGVPFALLSDHDLRFATANRLPTFAIGETTYLKRLTLVLQDGRIRTCFYPVFPPAEHARAVLDWLAANP